MIGQGCNRWHARRQGQTMIDGLPDAIFFNIASTWFSLACDHALPLHLCNLFLGGGHDTILHRSHARKPESGLLSGLDKKTIRIICPVPIGQNAAVC